MKRPSWPRIRWRIFAERFSLWEMACVATISHYLYLGRWIWVIASVVIMLAVMGIVLQPFRPLNLRPFRPDDSKPD